MGNKSRGQRRKEGTEYSLAAAPPPQPLSSLAVRKTNPSHLSSLLLPSPPSLSQAVSHCMKIRSFTATATAAGGGRRRKRKEDDSFPFPDPSSFSFLSSLPFLIRGLCSPTPFPPFSFTLPKITGALLYSTTTYSTLLYYKKKKKRRKQPATTTTYADGSPQNALTSCTEGRTSSLPPLTAPLSASSPPV